MSSNLYDLPDPLPSEELFTDLIPDAGVKIERIVSSGQSTPEGEWYDQERDEWVALIQGKRGPAVRGRLGGDVGRGRPCAHPGAPKASCGLD